MAIDFSDFLPIRRESLATIRPRIDGDANAGVAPASDDFVDVTTGGYFADVAQALAIEQERLWDFGSTEVPAVAFITTAWGRYLDMHGDVLGVPRKAAAFASVIAHFTGTNGTQVGTNFQIATLPTDPDQDPVVFQTTTSGTIAAGVLDLPVVAIETGVAGNVPVGALSQFESATPTGLTAVTNLAPTAGGAEPESDQAYRARLLLEFGSTPGAGTIGDYQRWALAYPGVGAVAVEPVWAGDGSVRVVVLDANNNPVGPATVSGLQAVLDPFFFTTLTVGDTDLSLTNIINVIDAGSNTPNAGSFYVSGQRISYTGKTATSFTGCTGGSGTILAGSQVAMGGQGRGKAPIGAEVLVTTAASLIVPVVGTVTHRPGYSLDGTNGTTATRVPLIGALADYINSLPPGEDIPVDHARARFFTVPGVWRVSGVTVSGQTDLRVVSALEVPVLGSVTLTDSGASPT
jgi:uncharacterized phage protein gp47/JayE